IAAGEASLALSGRHSYCVMSMALTYAHWNKREEANALFMELQWRARREHVSLAALAATASAAKNSEAAIEYARESYRRHELALICTRHFTEFALLREDPRFMEILDLIGLK